MSPASSWPRILFPLWDSCDPPVASRPGAVYTSPWSKNRKFDRWHRSLSHLLTRWVFLLLSVLFPATDGMEENSTCKEGVFKILFYFSLSCSYFISNKLTSFPQVESVLPMAVVAEWSLPVLMPNHKPFVIFSLPCPAEDSEWQNVFGGHLASRQGQFTMHIHTIQKLTKPYVWFH